MGINIFSRSKKTKPPPAELSTASSSAGKSSLSSEAMSQSPSFVRRVQNTDDLREAFKKFDTNGDGKISMSELDAVLRCLGGEDAAGDADSMMREADLDGDGFISLEEFISVNTTEMDAARCMEDLRSAFTVFDWDKNGVISAEELHYVLRSLGEKASLAECKRMIQNVDKNGDGAINFEEFIQMMSRTSAGPLA